MPSAFAWANGIDAGGRSTSATLAAPSTSVAAVDVVARRRRRVDTTTATTTAAMTATTTTIGTIRFAAPDDGGDSLAPNVERPDGCSPDGCTTTLRSVD